MWKRSRRIASARLRSSRSWPRISRISLHEVRRAHPASAPRQVADRLDGPPRALVGPRGVLADTRQVVEVGVLAEQVPADASTPGGSRARAARPSTSGCCRTRASAVGMPPLDALILRALVANVAEVGRLHGQPRLLAPLHHADPRAAQLGRADEPRSCPRSPGRRPRRRCSPTSRSSRSRAAATHRRSVRVDPTSTRRRRPGPGRVLAIAVGELAARQKLVADPAALEDARQRSAAVRSDDSV